MGRRFKTARRKTQEKKEKSAGALAIAGESLEAVDHGRQKLKSREERRV
jgi:hypothetical protein